MARPEDFAESARAESARAADTARQVLRGVWQADERSVAELDDIDAPKVCKRTTGLDFAGFSDPADVGADGDLRTAWRAKLAREGKLSTTGQSVRELVLGAQSADRLDPIGPGPAGVSR